MSDKHPPYSTLPKFCLRSSLAFFTPSGKPADSHVCIRHPHICFHHIKTYTPLITASFLLCPIYYTDSIPNKYPSSLVPVYCLEFPLARILWEVRHHVKLVLSVPAFPNMPSTGIQ